MVQQQPSTQLIGAPLFFHKKILSINQSTVQGFDCSDRACL